ncbi:unnamed protein product, partial [Allacma fusca]
MISLTGALVLCAISIIVYNIFFKNDGKKYPKGPMSLPLIGNMLELRGFIHLKLAKWADQYGDIFQIWFARNRITNSIA